MRGRNLRAKSQKRIQQAVHAAVEPLETRRLLALIGGIRPAVDASSAVFPVGDDSGGAELEAASWSWDQTTAALTVRGNGSSERLAVQLSASGTVEVLRNGVHSDTGVGPGYIITLTVVGNNGNDQLDLRGLDESFQSLYFGTGTMVDGGGGDDVLYAGPAGGIYGGGAGSDLIVGATPGTPYARSTLDGGDDNDTIRGGEGNESLLGGFGRDSLDGGGGADTLDGGRHADTIVGGVGADTYAFTAGSPGNSPPEQDIIVEAPGGAVENSLDFSALAAADPVVVNLTISGLGAVRNVNGSRVISLIGGDTFGHVTGTPGDDRITLTGNVADAMVRVDGGEGNDSIVGGGSPDFLSGGPGNDTLRGNGGVDTLAGEAGDDSLLGGDGADGYDFSNYYDTVAGAGAQPEHDRIVETPGTAVENHLYVVYVQSTRTSITIDLGDRGQLNYADGSRQADIVGADTFASVYLYNEGNDTVIGSAGKDDIRLDGGGGDVIEGGGGDDTLAYNNTNFLSPSITIDGGDGSDDISVNAVASFVDRDPAHSGGVIYGGDGFDNITVSTYSRDTRDGFTIDGGNDGDSVTLYDPTGAGVHHLIGGAGVDHLNLYDGYVFYNFASHDHVSTVDGGPDTDFLLVENDDFYFNGNYVVTGGPGNDHIIDYTHIPDAYSTQPGTHVLDGGDDDDEIISGGANDLLIGGAGNDSLAGHFGNDTCLGGEGDDLIIVARYTSVSEEDVGHNLLDGGAGDDSIAGGRSSDTIFGRGGDDEIYATRSKLLFEPFGAAGDSIDAGAGDDLVVGSEFADSLAGGLGNDTIRGMSGNDSLDGGDGDDQLFGFGGADTLRGGVGNDVVDGGAGSDLADGGAGNDRRSTLAPDAGDVFSSVESTRAGLFTTDVSEGRPSRITLTGSAAVVTNEGSYFRLTNAANQVGSMLLNDLDPGTFPVTSFDVSYQLIQAQESSTSTPGEGSCFTFGTGTASFGDRGFGSSHSMTVSFHTAGIEPSVDLYVGSTLVDHVPAPLAAIFDSSFGNYHLIEIHYRAGRLTVLVDHYAVIVDEDLTAQGFVPQAGDRFGFGARNASGGASQHQIDDLSIVTTTASTSRAAMLTDPFVAVHESASGVSLMDVLA